VRPVAPPGHARLVPRVASLLGGCAIATFCYALTIRASLGLGPLFVVQQGVARHIGTGIGQGVMVVGVAMVLVALALRSWPGPGTLVLPFLGGGLLDLMLPPLPAIHGLGLRLLVVAAATWVMAFGAALTIRAAVGVAAYDAVMLGLRRTTGRSLRLVRLAMELTMLGCGWLLGGSVGVGTAITAVLIGPGMQFWLVVLGRPSVSTASPGREPAAAPGPAWS